MKNSLIGWTTHTWNPWWGCTKVSPACLFCYIAQVLHRAGREPFNGPVHSQTWRDPFKWNAEAKRLRRRARVFTCSLSDFFHPGADDWRLEAWEVMLQCNYLDWLVLTKRPELVLDRLPPDWGTGYPNVWLGATVERQDFVHRLDTILRIPAAVHFCSAEPLLGPLDIRSQLANGLNWVITGCEQAHKDKRRPMDWDWVRGLQRQCDEAQAAYFLKQYYTGNQIIKDGMLDGRVCQAWPLPNRPLSGEGREIGRYSRGNREVVPAMAGIGTLA